jgi:hypothetical protein
MSKTITLLSNACLDVCPDNSLTRFTNYLPGRWTMKRRRDSGVALDLVSFHANFAEGIPLPRYIRVVLSSPAPATRGSERCRTTLCIIPLRRGDVKPGGAFVHVPRKREFVCCNLQLEQHVTLSLVDEDGERLRLTEGQPTVVRLCIKGKMESRAFNVRISSLDRMVRGPLHSLKANLTETPLDLDGRHARDWEMCLTSILYPPLNCAPPRSFVRVTRFPQGSSDPAWESVEPVGSFTTDEELAFRVNWILAAATNGRVELSFLADVRGRMLAYTAKDMDGDSFVIAVSGELAYIMGLSTRLSDEDAEVTVTRDTVGPVAVGWTVDLNRLRPQSMLLYCDAVKPSVVGSVMMPVLKLVPVMPVEGGEEAAYTQYKCEHLDFVTLQSNMLSELNFELRGLDGRKIAFESEKHPELQMSFVFRVKLNR